MDKLLITLSAASQDIESARAVRIVDASKRRLPLQKKVGAGMSVEEFRAQVAAGAIKHHGLPESVAMVSDALGLGVDEITETIEPVVARERVKTDFLEVAAGQVAGVHQIARGYAGKEEKIYMELQMYVGAQDPARYGRNRRQSQLDAHDSRRHTRRHRHRFGRRELHPGDPRRPRRTAHFARSADVFPPAGRKSIRVRSGQRRGSGSAGVSPAIRYAAT